MPAVRIRQLTFSICHFLAIGLLLLANLVLSTVSSARERGETLTDITEIVSTLTKKYGPLLQEKDAPTLHRYIDRIFGDLSRAQERLIGAKHAMLNKVYIIQSPIVNAFVVTDKQQGIRISDNSIVLTTGFIRKMMTNPNALSSSSFAAATSRLLVRQGLGLIAGASSHELGHPVNEVFVDGDYIAIRPDADQAIEIRADLDGCAILREAGYPNGSLLDALIQLYKWPHRQKAVEDLLNKHPEPDLRTSSLRLFLTVDDIKKGKTPDVLPFEVSDADADQIIAEIGTLSKTVIGQWAWVKPRSFSEAVSRLAELTDHIQHSDDEDQGILMRRISFNRLVLWIEDYLWRIEAGGASLPRSHRSDLLKFLDCIWAVQKEDKKILFSEEEIKSFMTLENGAAGFENMPSHITRKEKLKVFTSQLVKHHFHKKLEEDQRATVESALPALVNTLGASFALKEFDGWIRPRLAEELKTSNKFYSLFNRIPEEIQSAQQRLKFYLYRFSYLDVQQGDDRFQSAMNISLFPYALGSGVRETLVKAWREIKLLSRRDPNAKQVMEEFRAKIEEIWKLRGMIGTIQLIDQYLGQDWDLVAEILDLDKNQMENQISSAVFQYLKGEQSQGYPGVGELLRLVEDNTKKLNRSETPEVRPAQWKISWSRMSHVELLRQRIRESSVLVDKDKLEGTAITRQSSVSSTLYKAEIKKELSKFQAGPEVDLIAALKEMHQRTLQTLKSKDVPLDGFHSLYLDVIDQADLPFEVKQTWIDYLFVRKRNFKQIHLKDREHYHNWATGSGDRFERTWNLIRKYKIVNDLPSLIVLWRERLDRATSYFEKFNELSPRLLPELTVALTKVSSYQELQRWVELIKNRTKKNPEDEVSRATTDSIAIKDFRVLCLQTAMRLNLTLAQRYAFFLDVTMNGNAVESDAYFKEQILPHMSGDDHLPRLEYMLSSKRIKGSKLQLELAQKVFAPKLKALKQKSPIDRFELKAFIDKLNLYVPHGSSAKDEYLEDTGSDLGLVDAELNGFIEDQKSQNWRKANPFLINAGSLLSGSIANLTVRERESLLAYLIDPEKYKDGLPASVVHYFVNYYVAEEMKKSSFNRVEAIQKAMQQKYEVEALIRNSSQMERVPIIELLLKNGARALLAQPDAVKTLARRFMPHIKAGSVEEKFLEAYIETVPDRERGGRFGYLLSQSGEDKGQMLDLFLPFGPIGKKFAQMAIAFQLFGPDTAELLGDSTDNVDPMSRAEVLQHMHRHLEPGLLAQLKLDKRIAAASIKTVVRVYYKGDNLAMLVQPDNTENRIDSMLELGERFIANLEKAGLKAKSKLFSLLLEALKAQIKDEIKMTVEADNFDRARVAFESINVEMKGALGDFRFVVPKIRRDLPVKNGLMFMEEIEGTRFDRLSKADQERFGPLLVQAKLKMFQMYGVFDADRHVGNWYINLKEQRIYALDFGQLQNFKAENAFRWDERLTIASYFKAFAERDAHSFVKFAKMMMDKEKTKQFDEHTILIKTQKIFDRLLHDPKKGTKEEYKNSQALIDLVTMLADENLFIRSKYIFGILKGFLMLAGANYVSEDTFVAILKSELTQLIARKTPAVVMSKIVGCAAMLKGGTAPRSRDHSSGPPH